MLWLLSLLLLAGFAAAGTGRTVFALDHDWKYTLEGSAPAPLKPCQPADFPTDMTDKVTNGLTERQAIDEQECATACCSSDGCVNSKSFTTNFKFLNSFSVACGAALLRVAQGLSCPCSPVSR